MAVRAKSRRVEDAFELFQLEKRGDRASQKTLDFHQLQVGKFLRWVEQVAMVARLAGSGAGVECVEAAPGTGKTTALGAYVAACRLAGIPVTARAPSARARDELRLGARVAACYTVNRLLLDLEQSALEPGSVVILDEASMAGSRKLARLLERAAAAGAKVVLVADPREVRLPASYWNAKGRRRVSLAYCRTIHKAQGATYQGESFTLAGDDTIHLEAVHVALSRGTRANTLYYAGRAAARRGPRRRQGRRA